MIKLERVDDRDQKTECLFVSSLVLPESGSYTARHGILYIDKRGYLNTGPDHEFKVVGETTLEDFLSPESDKGEE